MSTLSIEKMSVGYGSKEIVHEVSFTCQKGHCYAILGENGCGKTTLFNGMMKQNCWVKGSCLIENEDILNMNARKKAHLISLLPQERLDGSGYSCLDMIMMGAYAKMNPMDSYSRKIQEKAVFLAEELSIHEWLKQDFAQISTGQKQLVLLARTLMQDTPVILLDELDNALDFEHKHQMMQYFTSMIKKKNKLGLFILHDLALALNYSDGIYLMKEGQMLEYLEPKKEELMQLEQKLRLLYPHIKLMKSNDQYALMYE